MGERFSRAWPVAVGVVAPLLLILTNTLWNYAGILLTIAAVIWLGFATILLAPGGTT